MYGVPKIMKPVKSLHKDFFSDNVNHVSIGTLSQKQIDFIEEKCPDYIGLLKPTTDIIFWKDRIKHTELHRDDFMSDIAYNNCFESIPDIIKSPDYISIHPKDHSLIFIKELSAHISVAIRISPNGSMAFRTMYPITEAQLQNYITKNRAWKYPNTA